MAADPNRLPIPQRLSAIQAQLDLLRGGFDADALQARTEELEAQMQAPGFWDDQQTAAKVSAEHARATRRLDAWRQLVGEIEDLGALAEMAEEEPSRIQEVEDSLGTVEARLADLEEGGSRGPWGPWGQAGRASRRSGCSPVVRTPATRSSR